MSEKPLRKQREELLNIAEKEYHKYLEKKYLK
jgi:hypothetical protein